MTITAVMIDSREPEWVQKLTFGGVPTSVTILDAGDLWVATEDGHTLLVERKTADDFLGSLADERLFPQMARMSEQRVAQSLKAEPVTSWPYLVICGQMTPTSNGKIVTDRGETGWNWSAVQGALLSFQEMGVMVVHAVNNQTFEQTVISIAKRNRSQTQGILPPRPGLMLGQGAALLATLPGIGPDRLSSIMQWSAGNVADALVGLADLQVNAPVGEITRKNIRRVLGLRDNQTLEIIDIGDKQHVS